MVQQALYFEQEQRKKRGMYQEDLNLLVQNGNYMKMQLSQKEEALEKAKNEIYDLKAGFYGSDWQLRQDLSKNQVWMFDGKRQEVLLEGSIQKVVAYILQTSEGSQFAFSVVFCLASGLEREVFLGQKDLESSGAMMQKLERARIYLRTKRSDKLKARLLARMVMDQISEIIALPECAGWKDHIFCFCDSAVSYRLKQIGFSAPYLDRYFASSRFDPEVTKLCVNSLFSRLGRENAILLLTITAGSLLYTPLREKGYQPDVLFALEGNTETVSAIRKWMQPWKRELCVTLGNKKGVATSIFASKDEILFLLDEGTRYSLNLGSFLNMLGGTGEIEIDGEIKQVNSLPLLITERSATWKKNKLSLISLSFAQEGERMQVDKNMVSDFWHSFCNFLTGTYDIWSDRIEKLNIPTYCGMNYCNTYQWLSASYNIFAPFLQMIIGKDCILSECEFSAFIGTWLQGVEQQNEMDIGDYFIFCLQQEKRADQIDFVSLDTFKFHFATKLTFATDSEWVYIPKENFTSLVHKFLPGCSENEIYVSLAESGSAKPGESGHIFPKSPLKASRNGIRARMAHVKRSLLLSDSEFLLEVG